MTVETTDRKKSFAGGQASLVFSFKCLPDHPEYIKVKTVTSGTESILTYTTDYTVSLNSDGVGGTVTVNPTFSTAYTYTVYRETAKLQESDYDDYNQFPADTVETDYDRAMLLAQEADEDVSRSLKASISSGLSDLELPTAEAGKGLKWSPSASTLIATTYDPDDAQADAAGYATSAGTSATAAGNYATSSSTSATEAAAYATSLSTIPLQTVRDNGNTITNAETSSGVVINQSVELSTSRYALDIKSAVAQTTSNHFTYLNISNTASTCNLMKIDNDGTGAAISLQQDGVLAAGKQGLTVLSNAVQVNADSALAKFTQDNAASSEPALEVKNDGTGVCVEIDQNGNGKGLSISNSGTDIGAYIQQNVTNAAGDHALFVVSSAAQTNSTTSLAYFDMDSASSTEPVVEINNNGTGAGLEITSSSSTTAIIKFNTTIGGNSTKAPQTVAPDDWIQIDYAGTPYYIPIYAAS